MAKKKIKKVKIYVCGVDWQHEVGEASDVKMYASVAALKRARTCWKSCGIVELEVTLSKWIEPQDFSHIQKEDYVSRKKE